MYKCIVRMARLELEENMFRVDVLESPPNVHLSDSRRG